MSPVRTRRRLIAAGGLMLAAPALLMWPAPAAANAPHPAAAYLGAVSQRAIDGLTNPERTDEEREALFRELLNEAFDIATIGRFVVGRYWRKASEEQRRNFLQIFEDVIVQRFLPLFGMYNNERLIVGNGQADKSNPRFIVVDSTFVDSQGTVVKVDWRMRDKDDHFQVFDVMVEGISMAITLRSEYASVIKNAGGLVGLVELLREKLERGEFVPKAIGSTQ
jgi:phospholipid transport system substrate-binding protein